MVSFLVGVALPFSLAARRGRGQTTGQMIGHALRRAFILVVLALVDAALPNLPFDLPPWERGKSPANLMVEAIEKIVPGITKTKSSKKHRIIQMHTTIEGLPWAD